MYGLIPHFYEKVLTPPLFFYDFSQISASGQSRYGILVYWYLGILVYWYPGILVSWYIGILVYWYIDILVSWYWYSGILVYGILVYILVSLYILT